MSPPANGSSCGRPGILMIKVVKVSLVKSSLQKEILIHRDWCGIKVLDLTCA